MDLVPPGMMRWLPIILIIPSCNVYRVELEVLYKSNCGSGKDSKIVCSGRQPEMEHCGYMILSTLLHKTAAVSYW